MLRIPIGMLILMSQTINLWFLGKEDEMFSARCWRLRKQPFWREMCWILDNASPLMFWRGEYATHCEACYWEEKRRLYERLDEYSQESHHDVR